MHQADNELNKWKPVTLKRLEQYSNAKLFIRFQLSFFWKKNSKILRDTTEYAIS